MPSEREDEQRAFLAEAGMAGARREALAGDASTRSYERIHPARGPSLIFMDQPPAAETRPCPPDAGPAERAALGYNALARLAAGRVDAFVACAGWLGGEGFSAPKVVFAAPGAGFALLEDLGDDLFARLIGAGAEEAPLYDAAVGVLARLHQIRPPARLDADGASWPLLIYDDLALKTAGDLLPEWLPRLAPELAFGAEALAAWEAVWAPVRARGAAGASVFCHRDFHAENLLWLPHRAGIARVGLLDFQDALRAHPAWDMSMLLHDARRSVSAEREAASLALYCRLRPEIDPAEFLADFHALGALNVCRIIGLFARLVVRDGKTRYGAYLPRLWSYLDRCLAPPAPAGLAAWLETWAPPERRAA